MASLVGEQVINIAEDIVENGLDPTTLTAIVRDATVVRSRYITLEGNRRLLALKALETPETIESVLTPGRRRRLQRASEIYRYDPISHVTCVVFDTPEEAWYWIELRHTGENGGVGLVRWGSDEQDRFRSRHGRSASRKPAGQILDFVDAVEAPSPGANNKILSNVARFIATPTVRAMLGMDVEKNVVYAEYPPSQIFRGLRKVVNDLRSNDIRVGDIYYEDDRMNYLAQFSHLDLPDAEARLSEKVSLSDLPSDGVLDQWRSETQQANDVPEGSSQAGQADEERASTAEGGSAGESTEPDPDLGQAPSADEEAAADDGEERADEADEADEANPREDANETSADHDEDETSGGDDPGGSQQRRSRVRPPQQRPFVIPRGVILFIPEARPNMIYNELRSLRVQEFPNACAVLLRVFVELSVDSYIASQSLMDEAERRNSPLAKRLKSAGSDLKSSGRISDQLERAAIKVADGSGPLGVSTTTFNQYVHNQFVFPNPSEILLAWDELQPLLEQLWSRAR